MCWKKPDRPLASFARSFGYAARGIGYCIRHERNFRFHLVAAAYVLGVARHFMRSAAEWAVLLLTIALVLAAEIFNTAVEHAVDLSCTEQNTHARIAKDAAAGAVLVCALGAIGVAVCLFARFEVWGALINLWIKQWWRLVLLALSVPLNVWFIFHNKESL